MRVAQAESRPVSALSGDTRAGFFYALGAYLLWRAGLLRNQMNEFLELEETRASGAGFRRLDIGFHELVAEGSGNRFVRSALMAHHRLRHASREGQTIPAFRMQQAMEEHLEILDALERKQFDLAADQMTVHLRRSSIRRPAAANRGISPLVRGAGA